MIRKFESFEWFKKKFHYVLRRCTLKNVHLRFGDCFFCPCCGLLERSNALEGMPSVRLQIWLCRTAATAFVDCVSQGAQSAQSLFEIFGQVYERWKFFFFYFVRVAPEHCDTRAATLCTASANTHRVELNGSIQIFACLNAEALILAISTTIPTSSATHVQPVCQT